MFGSDSVWYGSPQWQIEALWRFQIPEEMQKKYGYPELTEQTKRKILGLNSARLYGMKPGRNLGAQFKAVPKDYASKMTPEFKKLMEVDKPVAAVDGQPGPDASAICRGRWRPGPPALWLDPPG